MIRIATSRDVRRFLKEALALETNCKRLILCSPFIDSPLQAEICLHAAADSGSSIKVITQPAAARELSDRLSKSCNSGRVKVLPVENLHAKAYIMQKKQPSQSEAIVTSTNLTSGSLIRKVELGVLFTSTCDIGCKLLSDLMVHLNKLVPSSARNKRLDSITRR